MTPQPFTVIATASWTRRFGGPQSGGGFTGTATHIRCGGRDAYIRENLKLDTFLMDSGQRYGVAFGDRVHGAQVLELATAGDWPGIAAVVRAADALGRPVVINPQWTPKTAARHFELKGGRP